MRCFVTPESSVIWVRYSDSVRDRVKVRVSSAILVTARGYRQMHQMQGDTPDAFYPYPYSGVADYSARFHWLLSIQSVIILLYCYLLCQQRPALMGICLFWQPAIAVDYLYSFIITF